MCVIYIYIKNILSLTASVELHSLEDFFEVKQILTHTALPRQYREMKVMKKSVSSDCPALHKPEPVCGADGRAA